MQKLMLALAVPALATAALASSASAGDRPPNPAERARVEAVLGANGFVSWRKIERDDGKWEVDDARHANGRVYDVDIRGGRIVKRELED
ncbi:MAG: PepSY domain-containing protein [Hyphomicrobium zavarzinii]|uniref:PepSY domain-containing protein n=1 Tax=Hyphomicrobium zavarzinii TaxID=48292 RepID=UPI001A6217DC|nr:PepSY domain-containing protein [Hyphomicrobium zavarzinii]MBL8844488.1 PepSY domain-containing protein [Hyphomicrobium zavarzinii]